MGIPYITWTRIRPGMLAYRPGIACMNCTNGINMLWYGMNIPKSVTWRLPNGRVYNVCAVFQRRHNRYINRHQEEEREQHQEDVNPPVRACLLGRPGWGLRGLDCRVGSAHDPASDLVLTHK